jgi:hypothetical protein
MSGNRSKKERQARRERPAHIVNADWTLRSADAVLSVDLGDVALSHVNQFAIGWMRAAFEQSRVIANLTAAGMGHAAAPNRRAFWELALRLLWLGDMPQPAREEAADTMLAHGRSTETITDKHMREMGLESFIDIAAMEEIVLNASMDKQMQMEAKNLTEAVKATDMNGGEIYRLRREDSTWAHATGFLAGYYAPAEDDNTIGIGRPPIIDADLEAHRLAAMFIVFATGFLLMDEGVPSDLATAPTVAFHRVT